MDKLKSLLTPPPPTCTLAVVQYARADFGAGAEEELHWALFALTDARRRRGPSFQAIDRHYADARGVVWELHASAADAMHGARCLGGVAIGAVRRPELGALCETIKAHRPAPKFAGWNCRDWVLECVALLRARGWVPRDVAGQAALLPALRAAGARAASEGPVLVPLEDYPGAAAPAGQ